MAQANGGSVPITEGEGGVGVVVSEQQQQQQHQQTCPHREAAISMLPQADPTDGMSCDSCNKDIKFVSTQGVWCTKGRFEYVGTQGIYGV